MKPVLVKLPSVKGSGGRFGFNMVVTGLDSKGNLTGEPVDLGTTSIEMLPGDVLLSVVPCGLAKDRTKTANLLYANDHGALRVLIILPWDESGKARLARRYSAYREHAMVASPTVPTGGTAQPAEDNPHLRTALWDAYDRGLGCAEAIAICTQVYAEHARANRLAHSG